MSGTVNRKNQREGKWSSLGPKNMIFLCRCGGAMVILCRTQAGQGKEAEIGTVHLREGEELVQVKMAGCRPNPEKY